MSDRHIGRTTVGSQRRTTPGYERMFRCLRENAPFVPSEGWSTITVPKGRKPPFIHVLGINCSVITDADAAVNILLSGSFLRVGNSLTGKYITVWTRRWVVSRRYWSFLDYILVRCSWSEESIVIPRTPDAVSSARRAIQLSLRMIQQETNDGESQALED